jgi:hypothetical protein
MKKGIFHYLLILLACFLLQPARAQCIIDALSHDLLDANTPQAFKDFIKGNPEGMMAYKKYLINPEIRKDIDVLKSTANFLTRNADYLEKFPGKFDDILNNLKQAGARCKTCTAGGNNGLPFMHVIIDDLDWAWGTFKTGNIDIKKLFSEMAASQQKAEGGASMINVLRTNALKDANYVSSIKGLEYRLLDDGGFEANLWRRIDNKDYHLEFKSGGSSTAIVFTSKLRNSNLASKLQQDLNGNAAFKQLIEGNEDLVEAWEVLETAGFSALRTDANELQKLNKIIKDNHLTLDAAVDAVRSAAARVIPASLVAKITQNGAARLSNWFTGKTLRFVDEAGTVFTGAQAETRILEKLNTTIGDKAVIEVVEDTHGRLLVRTEGGSMADRVVSVERNVNGDYIVYHYQRAYKPSAMPTPNVDLSVNKLAPDYTTQGGIYLCPQSAMTNGQRNIVEITLTGNMAGDFSDANALAGFSSFGKEGPMIGGVQYTWHHLDDFNPATGRCTMQLVRQDAHTRIPGIAHSGGTAQYRAYNGRGYGK